MPRCLASVLTGWALLIGTAGVFAQQPAAPARAIIVFDASGSMYGKVPGGVKIDIAKKVVSDIVSAIDPGMELGLMAYGHRKKGDCEDIELLVPPQPNSAAAILQAVAALEPKGKTPLTAAVIQAAKYLKFEEAKVSVILVSDGVETCGKDPCMAAEDLERLGIDFTCHVIGFDLKQGEASGLECLAKKTGGMYLAAKDAASLKSSLEAAMKQVAKPVTTLVVEAKKSSGGALLDGVAFQVFAEGGGENAIATGSGGHWSTELPKAGKYTLSAKFGGKTLEVEATLKEGETVTKEVVFTETGLKAVAYDKEGGVAFEKEVGWELYGPADAEGKREQMAFSYDARPFLKVAPGSYLLTATRGNATASVNVEVKEGPPQEVKVILGSGNLKLSAVFAEGGAPITKDLSWDIYSPPDAEGQRRKAGFSYDAQPTLSLPAGKYLVEAQVGDTKGNATIEIVAGKRLEKTVVLGAGRVKLSASAVAGQPPIAGELSWDVSGEPDADGNRVQAATSYDDQPTLSLPAGKYQLQVKWGSAVVKKDIQVEAGKLLELPVVLNAGTLAVTAHMAEGADAAPDDLTWDILGEPNAEGERPVVASSFDAQPKFHVTAGKYLISVKRGGVSVGVGFEVTAGKLNTKPVILNAGMLKLSSSTPGGWDIYGPQDAEGNRKKIFYSYDANIKVAAPAGKVLVVRAENDKKAEQEIEVQANKLTELTLDAK